MRAPTREEGLEGLRLCRKNRNNLNPDAGRLDGAIAFLEGLPSRQGRSSLTGHADAVEVLLQMRFDVGIPSWEAHLDLVIAYLEGLEEEPKRPGATAEEERLGLQPPPGRPASLGVYDLAPCMYNGDPLEVGEPDVEELKLAPGAEPQHGWAYCRRDEVAALLRFISTASHAQKEAQVALEGLMGTEGAKKDGHPPATLPDGYPGPDAYTWRELGLPVPGGRFRGGGRGWGGGRGRRKLVSRDRRQHDFYRWAVDVFGPIATDTLERTARFLEEAVELAHALGLSRVYIEKIVKRVFERPVGSVNREVGQVGVTLLALCERLGISASTEELREWGRVTSVPVEEMRARQQAKVEAGIALPAENAELKAVHQRASLGDLPDLLDRANEVMAETRGATRSTSLVLKARALAAAVLTAFGVGDVIGEDKL